MSKGKVTELRLHRISKRQEEISQLEVKHLNVTCPHCMKSWTASIREDAAELECPHCKMAPLIPRTVYMVLVKKSSAGKLALGSVKV